MRSFSAWIMFDNHTFAKATGIGLEGLRKDIERIYDEYGENFIAGWGRIHFTEISSDILCLMKGLHKREELSKLNDLDFESVIHDKIQQIHNEMVTPEKNLERLGWLLSEIKKDVDCGQNICLRNLKKRFWIK